MGYCYAIYQINFYINSTVNPPIPRGHWALTSDRPKRHSGWGRGWGGQGGAHEERHGGSETEDARSS